MLPHDVAAGVWRFSFFLLNLALKSFSGVYNFSILCISLFYVVVVVGRKTFSFHFTLPKCSLVVLKCT